MNIDPNETIESQGTYKGYRLLFSSLGKFIVFVYQKLFIRSSLQEATDLIDELEKSKRN